MPSLKRTVTIMGESAPAKKSFKRTKVVGSFNITPKRKRKSYGQSGPEMKFLDTAQLNQSIFTPTGLVYPMNNIAQGTTNITRIGNKIQIKSVAVRAVCETAVLTDIIPNVVRYSIVLDKEPEAGAIAAYTDIFATSDPMSFLNIDKSDRFVVLKSGILKNAGMADSTAVGWASQPPNCIDYIDEFVPCDVATKYVGTGALQSSMGSNQLLFCTVAQNNDANRIADMRFRIRFLDE